MIERVLEVVRDRKQRGRMSEAAYWNDRVRSRTGHARSVWHAANFSDAWHRRQVHVLREAFDELLGGAFGLDALDVGCGTGRITFELDLLGAEAVGVDFSEAAIEDARAEAAAIGARCRFEVGDLASSPLPFPDASFDLVCAVGCLAVACRDRPSLDRSLLEVARLLRPRGAVVLLEPIHTSWLLGRVLKEPVDVWLRCAQSAGLRLRRRAGMGFVPFRLALSSFDLPPWFVRPAFEVGEAAIDRLPISAMADYALLGFHRADRPG
ncbi:MAG: class I SAM-dependent methyltransferase [Polyangiaceae bacterium]|jgi:SAM-dependent methyltransferase|nr:class I SAM-dependent methyltransferase [Polyangiaceae bacterium]